MHHSLPLNVKRSYTLRESHLNVSLVPFFTVWLCNRKKHASAQSPFSAFNILLLPFLSLINSGLCSYLAGALYTHRKITEMNHSEVQRGFSVLRQNLPNKQAKSSLEESPSTWKKIKIIVGSSMSEVFENKPKSNRISCCFN